MAIAFLSCFVFSRQVGSPTRSAGIHTGGHQICRKVQTQPPRTGREASRVAENLIRGGPARDDAGPRTGAGRGASVRRAGN